jgi:phosphoribosylpyrophosphate synthetase
MNPYEVLVRALTLAVDAPDEDRAQRATALAEALIADFGISEFEVRRAQREVERNG